MTDIQAQQVIDLLNANQEKMNNVASFLAVAICVVIFLLTIIMIEEM
jgi:hypothetical protein